jgi:hypothetical protein
VTLNRIRQSSIAASLFLLATSSPALGFGADDWYFSGYLKSFAVIQGSPGVNGLGDLIPDQTVQSQNALRLMLTGKVSKIASLELHYEIKPQFSSSATRTDLTGLNATSSSSGSLYRYRDLNNEITSGDGKETLLQNLDRFNLRLTYDPGDLTIGRQAIAFGSARFISPTDIFEPFLVSTLDTEYRIGVDAIRFQGSLGDLTEYDLGIVIGRNGDHKDSALYARAKTSIHGNDIEGVVIARDEMTLVGGGIERALGNLGFWAEVAYSDVKVGKDYTRFSTGLDKAFGENIFTMIEYHYSSAGSSDPDDYLGLLNNEAFKTGGVFLLGEHYLIPSLTWTVTPLLGLNASGFFNLGDGSGFLRLGGNFSLTDDLYTDFGVYAGFGQETDVTLFPPAVDLGSEYGSFPPTFYASLRYYF